MYRETHPPQENASRNVAIVRVLACYHPPSRLCPPSKNYPRAVSLPDSFCVAFSESLSRRTPREPLTHLLSKTPRARSRVASPLHFTVLR